MASDLDSAPNTVAGDPPPPPSAAARVRLMCSLGGRILPRPHDNQLRYVGGDTRIVAVNRSDSFSALHEKLAKIAGSSDVAIKYQLPNEDLDALISVTADEDVENMMEEHHRLVLGSSGGAAGTPRIRVFLFPPGGSGSAGGFGSILEGAGSKRESWFVEVLNGGIGRLERGRSDVSSLVSEVPDYLFGLDNSSEEPKPKARPGVYENASEPGSPGYAAWSSKYSSTSSSAAAVAPPLPDLPSVKTKVEETQIQQQAPVYAANPVWQYEPVPVYYMPGQVPGGNMPVRPFQVPVQYFNQAPQMVARGYRPPPVQGIWSNPGHGGPVYFGGPVGPAAYDHRAAAAMAIAADTYVLPAGGGSLRNVVYPAMGIAPAGGEAATVAMPEMRIGRPSQ